MMAVTDDDTRAAVKDLRRIPGIGPSLARDLLDLGYSRVESLVNEDPQAMYDTLCQMRGAHIDRCVLYTFRCAVYFATQPAQEHDPELLKWWNWKEKTETKA